MEKFSGRQQVLKIAEKSVTGAVCLSQEGRGNGLRINLLCKRNERASIYAVLHRKWMELADNRAL
jgi:hypothetical protein